MLLGRRRRRLRGAFALSTLLSRRFNRVEYQKGGKEEDTRIWFLVFPFSAGSERKLMELPM